MKIRLEIVESGYEAIELMFAMKKLIWIFWFSTLCYANTGFIQLLGYGLLADTTSTYSTSDPTDCVNECAATDGCLAIQMVWGSGTCKLMNMIRAYTWEAEQCGFYIKNETDVTITGRSLGAMDQVLQNVVYASKEECPDGWTVGSTTCTLSVIQSTCNEYASFLEATYDGTDCVIPLMNVTYSCPNSVLLLNNFVNGYFCYAVIWRNTTVITSAATVDDMNNFCYQQTGAYLASIHSDEENSYISSLRNTSKSNNAIAIGLIPDEYGYNANTSEYSWIDGTPLDYENFANITTNKYILPIVMLNRNELWLTNAVANNTMWIVFHSLACKRGADATFTKIT